jgi:hypothetical protein
MRNGAMALLLHLPMPSEPSSRNEKRSVFLLLFFPRLLLSFFCSHSLVLVVLSRSFSLPHFFCFLSFSLSLYLSLSGFLFSFYRFLVFSFVVGPDGKHDPARRSGDRCAARDPRSACDPSRARERGVCSEQWCDPTAWY